MKRHDPFWLVLVAAAFACLFAGCSILPQKRTDSAAVATVEKAAQSNAEKFSRVVEGQPAPAPVVTPPAHVTVSGSSNAVTFAAPASGPYTSGMTLGPGAFPSAAVGYREEVTFEANTSASAGTSETASAFSKVSLPLGVSLILFAAGIVAVFLAIRFARRSSAAVNVAWEAGDQFAAGIVRKLKNLSATETDERELAWLNQFRAEIEEERGRMSAQRKAKP